MKSPDLQQFQRELNEELLNILAWWEEHAIDRVNGGFYGRILNDKTVDVRATKGVVLNTRILWTFSAAARFVGPHYLGCAERAFEFLVSHFVDSQNGGVFWEVEADGRSLNTRKQIYALAFAIYAFTEYHLASGSTAALEMAKSLYRDVELHSRDESTGYLEAYSRDWQLLEDVRLSERDANEKKTMNTHLHLLEAYTNLARAWSGPALLSALEELLNIFLQKVINHETNHLGLFFDEHWQLRSNVVSYGHDIEGTWLLCEAAEVLGNTSLHQTVRQASVRMATAVLTEGIDTDGSLVYETTGDRKTDRDRHWWPQAEAMVGFMNAYQLTGESTYLQVSWKIWEYIQEHLVDRENGEWFWRVSKHGSPYLEEYKGGFWKGPYHNSRACMEMIRRIDLVSGR